MFSTPSWGRNVAGAAGDRGMTLIEVMIAALLLVIVLFWLTQYYVQGRKHLDYEEQRRKATALAQARLDEARTWSYDYLLSLADSVAAETTRVVDGRPYTVGLRVEPGPNPYTSRVEAVVTWEAARNYEAGNAFTRSDTTTTLIARSLKP